MSGARAGADVLGRLRDLEARVQLLESRAADSPDGSDGTARRDGDGDRFWALDRLRATGADGGSVLFAGTVATPDGHRYEWQQGHASSAVIDADWSESVTQLSALAHPVRLLLLHEVLNGSHTVSELASHEKLGTTGQLYHHLRQLVAAGWLRAGGQGRYEVPGERVIPLLVTVAAARR